MHPLTSIRERKMAYPVMEYVLIAGIVVLALTLRLWNLEGHEVVTDEGNYALRAIGWNDFMMSGTLTTPWNWFMEAERLPLWTQLSFNDHPPIHFLAIWISTHIFGVNLWAVRLPSALFGVGSILLLIFILRLDGKNIASYIAGYFLAILPWHVYISRHGIQESQVIFWIFLCVWSLLKAEHHKQKQYWFFMLAGASFGLGMMTKYSMAVVIPFIVYMAVKNKWHKSVAFRLSCAAAVLLMLPVTMYNFFVYRNRGHFDLQISRFLKFDTTRDWPASQQALWQGDIAQFFDFLKNLSSWIGIVSVAVMCAGCFFILREWKKSDFSPSILAASFGMTMVAGITSVLTLPDYGRSSIILPFLSVAFGISGEKLFSRKNTYLTVMVLAAFFMLFTVTLADFQGKIIFPKQIAFSFHREELGFSAWEEWQKTHLNLTNVPTHYASFREWMLKLSENINTRSGPIVVYDQRISWFQANWYFYRHSMYFTKTPVLHSSFFMLLLQSGLIQPYNREIFYVQIDTGAKDLKAGLDALSWEFEKTAFDSVTSNGIEPIVIEAKKQEPLLKVWRFIWPKQL